MRYVVEVFWNNVSQGYLSAGSDGKFTKNLNEAYVFANEKAAHKATSLKSAPASIFGFEKTEFSYQPVKLILATDL